MHEKSLGPGCGGKVMGMEDLADLLTSELFSPFYVPLKSL